MQRMNEETGAVAIIVALSLVALFGFGALVVDLGNGYWERRQLQTGAEAAALAAAQEYAEGGTGGTAEDLARQYATNNNTRGAWVEEFTPTASDVTVVTRTGDEDGPGVLSSWLASVIGHDTYFARARAVAAWGYPKSLATIPLVISTCEYDDDTETFTGEHPIASAVRTKLVFHQGTGGDEDPCAAQAGHDVDGDGSLPAGFGWISNDGSCQVVTTNVDGQDWVDKAEGNDPECDGAELATMLDTVIQIPVFVDFCRPPHDPAPDCPDYNNKDKYRLVTYASFYLEGYRLGGGPAYSGGDYSICSSSERCLVGYFTVSTVSDGEFGGPEGGVLLIKLMG